MGTLRDVEPPAVGPPAGLTGCEAAARLAVDGRNETRLATPPSVVRRVARQLADPLILVLLASAAVTATVRDLPDTTVILLVIVVNTVIGVTQEIRADRAVAALARLGAPTCRVSRDGTMVVIAAAEVVRGDVVMLTAGDIVPADITILEAHRLQVDESALTGESIAVDRAAGGELAAGTVVAAGRATGTVIRTAEHSALGRIVTLTEHAHSGPTPLQRRLAHLGRVLGTWIIALSAVVTAMGIIRGRSPLEMAIVGVALVVAAVPESLPAVVTLALSLGARRMAVHHAIARQLTAVETLGSVTVLVSDKTGTLTQGRMAVLRAATLDATLYTITGTGHDPTGRVHAEHGVGDGDLLIEMATAAVLCNDARLVPPDRTNPAWAVAGEQIEGALLAFAARVGLDIDTVRDVSPRVSEEPFDPATRMMSTAHARPDGTRYVTCKGAPEAVLRAEVVYATAAERQCLRDIAAGYAGQGLRVLAIAAGPPGRIRPLGVVGIGDPVRSDAPTVLRRLATAGVTTVIVTGDHPQTARHIAAAIGIWQPGDRTVDCSTDNWQATDLAKVRVFARARPDQKLAIVEAFQTAGAVVAVTGDGVNDAPALRRADIGVAMGGGTEVARQAANLILADDRLDTVVSAVAEGRRVYDNIRRFLRYALSGGAAELLTMLAGPLLGLAIPILPAQILWINLLTHGLPGVAMGAEPGSDRAMHRPPRARDESVLGAGLGRAALLTGTLIATCTLAVGAVAAHLGLPWQSLAFLVLGFAQLGVALAVRAPRRPGHHNRWLGAAVATSAALLLAAVTMAPLRDLLRTDPVTITQLAVVLAVAAIPGVAVSAPQWRAALTARRQQQPSADLPDTGTGPSAPDTPAPAGPVALSTSDAAQREGA